MWSAQDRNLSTDVLNTIFKILVGISPNICSLMSIYSVVFSPEQLTSLKTILINYERGVIHEKKDAFAEITQLFTGLSTYDKNKHIEELLKNALTLDDNYNNPIKDERQNASKKDLNYAILGEISPHVCKLMETYSIVFSPDQLESVNTILISYSERIWSVKESLHAIGEIFKKLLTDEKHVNIKDEFMNALLNDYDFPHFDPISLFTTESMFNTLLTSNPYMVYP